MAVDLKTVLDLVDKILDLEKAIEYEIRKEANARKRKKLRKAYLNRDNDRFRALLFD